MERGAVGGGAAEQFAIVNALVGRVSEQEFATMAQLVQLYVTPSLSLAIPYLDFCRYAITPNHTHPAYLFVYYHGGPAQIRVQGQLRGSPFGNRAVLCALSPNIVHEECVQEQFTSYVAVLIDKEYFERELALYGIQSPRLFAGEYFEAPEALLTTLQRFIVEHQQSLPCREKMLASLSLQITHQIIRTVTALRSADIKISKNSAVSRLISHLNERFAQKITVRDMAQFVNLSPSHFARLFKQDTGESPTDYLINLRVQKAKQLLQAEHHSITAIAFSCGFSSASHFTSSFTERMGLPPGEYRKKQLLQG
jgi:AraC-like DNA-binding protein